MRVLYIGAVDSNAGWGAEWFLNKAFRDLGHETHGIDFRRNRHRLYRSFLSAPPCDFCFVQRGDNVPTQLLDIVQAPMALWETESTRPSEPLVRHGRFDHYFVWEQSTIERYVDKGWARRDECSLLFCAFDPSLHRPMPDVEKDIDVLFIGSMTDRRQRIVADLSKQVSVAVLSAFGQEMVKLIRRAKIVLNLHAYDFPMVEARVFEVLGCGAFLLTERLSPENPFSDDHLTESNSVDDLAKKARYYLTHADERVLIARQGHEAAMAAHTYLHRARAIMAVAETLRQQAPARQSRAVASTAPLTLHAAAETLAAPVWALSEAACSAATRSKRLVRAAVRRRST